VPEQHFDTPYPVHLYVQIGKGGVDVVAGETGTTRLTLDGLGADEVDVRHEGDRLEVVQRDRTGFLRDKSVHVRVEVPAGSSPAVRTGSAPITLRGPLDSTEVRTGSGDVTTERLDGSSLLETGSGDVRIGDARGDARVKSGSGEVRVARAEGDLAVSTGSGDVTVDSCHGAAAVKTGSGDVVVQECSGELSLATGSGDLLVRRALRGRVLVKGASGDVHLGVPVGLPVWTDISTVSGSVRSDLEPVGEPGDGEDHLEVRTTTVSGDVVLAQV
jgi:hypothetical protein